MDTEIPRGTEGENTAPEKPMVQIGIPILSNRERNNYHISWSVDGDSALETRLFDEGLGINQVSVEECRDAIREIKCKYFPNEYKDTEPVKDEWKRDSSGMYSLTCLNLTPNSDKRLSMLIFAHKDEKNRSFGKDWLVEAQGRIQNAHEALCLYECLLVYLKYAGINVSGLRSEFVEKDGKRILSSSFNLPYVEEYADSIVKMLRERCGLKLVDRNGNSIVTVAINDRGEKEWVLKDLQDTDLAINCFNVITLNNQYPDLVSS